MFSQVTLYIANYGYLALFCIILLMELGMPGLPNEVVLIYFGYACHKARLFFPAVLGTGIAADITGSLLLYFFFLYGRNRVIRLKPKWLRVSSQKINQLTQKIGLHRGRNLFIAKMTPFLRGYVSVVAGLLQIPPVLYVWVTVFTAISWTGVLLTVGWLLALE
jgi:membrane protein DedA with SNARE-associated domain